MHLDARLTRPTVGSVAYVVGVGLLVGVGLAIKSPAPVLLAVVVSLPLGFAALVAYYLAYGLLAQLPGATSATSSGSGVVNPDGSGIASSTGDAAQWFVVATPVVAVLLFVAAACLNVVMLRLILAQRRSFADSTRGPGTTQPPASPSLPGPQAPAGQR